MLITREAAAAQGKAAFSGLTMSSFAVLKKDTKKIEDSKFALHSLNGKNNEPSMKLKLLLCILLFGAATASVEAAGPTYTYLCKQSRKVNYPEGNYNFVLKFKLSVGKGELITQYFHLKSVAEAMATKITVQNKSLEAYELLFVEPRGWDPHFVYERKLATGQSGWALLLDDSGTRGFWCQVQKPSNRR